MFKDKFPWPDAGEGHFISCWHEGFFCVASIHYDDTSGDAPDKRMDGFWPSLDPKDDGFIGFKHTSKDYGTPQNRVMTIDARDKARLARQMARAEKIMQAWVDREWYYCGVAVEVFPDDDCHEKLGDASLWGIECNYPSRQKNNYLTTVANDLLGEALSEARCNPSYLTKYEFEIRMRAAATTVPRRMKLALAA